MDSLKVPGLDKNFVKMDIKYRIWSRKIHYLLNSKKLDYVLNAREPIITEKFTQEERDEYQKWKQDNYSARPIILNALDDIFSLDYENETRANVLRDYDGQFKTRRRQGQELDGDGIS